MNKIIVLSDLHCGHILGLTKGGWPAKRFHPTRRKLWKIYEGWRREIGPVDHVFINGDAIDGKGTKAGGTETLEMDRSEQAKMAVEAISIWDAKKYSMTYGTPYHTGCSEDWEDTVADLLGAQIGGQLFIEIEGVHFNLKHYIGNSSIPHGRHTAIAKEKLWNLLWQEAGVQEKADVYIRSHVHYHAGAFGPGWMGMITPGLQGLGSKYGSRLCSGVVHFGLVYFEVDQGGYRWNAFLEPVGTQKSKILRFG